MSALLIVGLTAFVLAMLTWDDVLRRADEDES